MLLACRKVEWNYMQFFWTGIKITRVKIPTPKAIKAFIVTVSPYIIPNNAIFWILRLSGLIYLERQNYFINPSPVPFPESSLNRRSTTLLEEFPFYMAHRLNNLAEPYRCRFLKTFYRELGTRDPPHLPPWASPLPLGTLCPAHFQPHLQLVHKSEQEHRLENIKPDQIFAPVRVSVIKIR